MSAQKCQKCGVRVFFYRDKSTGAEKCPSCGTTNPHTQQFSYYTVYLTSRLY